MTITFYMTSDRPEVVNKTIIQLGTSRVLAPTGQVDQLNPVILTDYSETFVNANYCYIDTFHRYYWCTTAISTAGRLIISCHVDYLMSWKDSILQAPATVIRAEQAGINYVIDDKLPIDSNRIYIFGADLDGDPLKISDSYLYRYLLITNS